MNTSKTFCCWSLRMRNRIAKSVLLLALPALALCWGCGNYTITFEAADVINAWGEDITAEMLDVDILCLTKEDVKNHPEIVQRSMRADDWFRARMEDSPRIADIDAKQIYALRRGAAGDKRDTLLGLPLLSAKDREDGLRKTTVKVHHPTPLSGEAAIVIYGKFSDQMGIAKTPPVVIQPPPSWNKEIYIKVGRRDMRRVEPE